MNYINFMFFVNNFFKENVYSKFFAMTKLPREELSYKTIYPGLLRHKKLKVVNSVNESAINEILPIKKNIGERNTYIDDLNNVDYCINEQDQDFIKRYLDNNKIFCDKYESIAVDLYELIMDRITKEWRYTQLIMLRNYYKKNKENRSKVNKFYCDICTKDQVTESNLILKCNGCNVLVHQECYGVPNLEKQTEIENVIDNMCFVNQLWFCRKCLFFKDLSPRCKFCPNDGNAYKPIHGSKRWGHILCAKFIKSLHFSNLLFLEPIEEQNIEHKEQKNQQIEFCVVCESNKGRFGKCFYKDCSVFYHITCGINSGFYFDMQNVITYCDQHDPTKTQETNKINNDSYKNLLELNLEKTKSNNYEKIKAKPVIRNKTKITELKETFLFTVKNLKQRFTDYYANRIFASDLCQFKDDLVFAFMYDIGQYWNVKNNRYYEPGNFLSMKDYNWKEWNKNRSILCLSNKKTDNECELHKNNIKKLKNGVKDEKKTYKMFLDICAKKCKNNHIKEFYCADYVYIHSILQMLRNLIDLMKKKKELQHQRIVINMQIYRLKNDKVYKGMYKLTQSLISNKKFLVFVEPVTENIAPYYFTYIKEPMCLKVIQKKLENTNYNYTAFIHDLNLIISNCRLYNHNNMHMLNVCNKFEKAIHEFK